MKSNMHSFSVSVNASHAILNNRKFAELSGISRVSQGKRWQEWSEEDRRIWHNKLNKDIGHLNRVTINYLASEEAFFVRPERINPYLVPLEPKARLYQQIVAGKRYGVTAGIVDFDEVVKRVELRIYCRGVHRGVQNLGWCLTVATYCDDGQVSSERSEHEKLEVLCDFPLAATQMDYTKADELVSSLGFKVDRSDRTGGPFEDEFGDSEYGSNWATYEKNGVELYR